MALPHWPAPLSVLPPATCAALVDRLPACAPDCADGECLYRCLAAWAVPWRRVPKAHFWKAWSALHVARRRRLVAVYGVYVDELAEKGQQSGNGNRADHWVVVALLHDDCASLAALLLDQQSYPRYYCTHHARKYVRIAAFRGALQCLRVLCECYNSRRADKAALIHACQGGHMHCVRYLCERGVPWTEKACTAAARGGHLHCLQYLHKHGCPWFSAACYWAAKGGHLRCLKFLHENGCPWTAAACEAAARVGHAHCLLYLCEHSCPWTAAACESAARFGHLPCLQFLLINGCPWTKNACIAAAKGGHLSCLRHLHEHGCPLTKKACEKAASGGHLSCLQYLHEHGCPWTERAFKRADRYGHLSCLQYLRKQDRFVCTKGGYGRIIKDIQTYLVAQIGLPLERRGL